MGVQDRAPASMTQLPPVEWEACSPGSWRVQGNAGGLVWGRRLLVLVTHSPVSQPATPPNPGLLQGHHGPLLPTVKEPNDPKPGGAGGARTCQPWPYRVRE